MATSQPIAFPAPNSNSTADYPMGSYSGEHGRPFNPASYTRHFLGSPISWRAGSFGARFPQNSPSAQLFSSLDNPKSAHFDEVSVMNAFNVFDREGELCRNYNCCGINLPDLHALLEHFEDVHVLVDPAAQAQITVPFNPQPIDSPFESDDMELELDLDNSTQPPPPSVSSHSSPSSSNSPQTPCNPVLAQFAHAYPQYSPYTSAHNSPYTSQPPSPGSAVHFPNATPAPVRTHPEEVFNAYARFSADYSSHMPGTQLNASNGEEIHANPTSDYPTSPNCAYAAQGLPPISQQQSPGQQCIPPALLFASASPSSPPQQSNNAPAPTNKLKLKVRGGQATSASTPPTPSTTSALTPFSTNTAPSAAASTVPSTPTPIHTPVHTPLSAPSLLLSKPFRCPKPNCNKSYKQANGLKYHMTHGSCNFAPPKDLEHVKDLLERKRREREANGLARSASLGARPSSSPTSSAAQPPPSGEFLQLQGLYSDLGLGQITETELRDIEREAERRLKPFACGVGDCQRRYKNMNGLRYHYQHSGDHGAVGLALLAGGLHDCLGNNRKDSSGVDNASSTGSQGEKSVKVEEREGRRKVPHIQAPQVQRVNGMMRNGGSASVPVSRATSVVANSRVGTPAPMVPVPVPVLQKSVSFPPQSTTKSTSAGPLTTTNEGAATTTTTPFTPGYTNPVVAGQIGVAAAAHTSEVLQQQQAQSSPPMTPLTAAVQGLGLASQSQSPPRQHCQQQQQQLAYQAQFVELQRRQYLQMQAQAQQAYQQQQQAYQQQYDQQQQQQQQYDHQQGYGQQQQQIGEADAMAQQEFVDAQRREFEFQQGMVGVDVVMG
ncbi:hypothetical protein C0995_000594 [Termitomyces sp. Mi166|nr:hypothetical protein C0995_000594 [Termitomyces sp. Mi166\